MWKLDRDEDYFKILDQKKDIAGYFDPDYGELFPKGKEPEIIEEMHKKHEKIRGGFLMVPMVKFGIFDPDSAMDIPYLNHQLDLVQQRLNRWKNFILDTNLSDHTISVSHTDQDMLSIAFPIKFSKPTPLEKNSILEQIGPTLDLMQKQGLL